MTQEYQLPLENNNFTELFNKILAQELVYSVFQAIFNLADGNILGFEALGRGINNTPLHSPLVLLQLAEKNHKLYELNSLFLQTALKKAASSIINKYLFLNIDPQVISLPAFREKFTKEYLLEYNFTPQLAVLEISERNAIEDYSQLRLSLDTLTKQGFLIALDDVGAGYSGLKTISELKPTYLKIDMDLVRNIHKDLYKQSMVKALVDISNTLNIKLIAEGIETTEELETIFSLGVQFAQGFLLHKPQPDLAPDISIAHLIKRRAN
jgi:EAL domain-containing protein (putative c-di-GMP-specific phosphodiesterase class I)